MTQVQRAKSALGFLAGYAKRCLRPFALYFLSSLALAGILAGCMEQGVALGESAPSISAKDFRGRAVSLEDFAGKAIIIRFWNRGCTICMREMPYLEKLQREHEGKFVVLAINAHDSPAEIERVRASLGVSYPLLRDDLDITTRRYGVVAIPTMFLIDKEGKVRDKIYGEQPWNSVRTRILGIL